MAGLATLKVTKLDGDSYTVDLLPAVVIAAEEHFSQGFSRMFEDGSLKALYWSAWKATHVSGRVVEPYDEWLLTLANVELVERDKAPLGGA